MVDFFIVNLLPVYFATLILWIRGAHIPWWQTALIMLGVVIWNFGFKEWLRDSKHWTGKFRFWFAGFLIAVIASFI